MSTEKKKVTCVLFLRRIPTELRDRFRSWCELRRLSMRSVITDMMRERIKDQKLGQRYEKARSGPTYDMFLQDMPVTLVNYFKAWCALRRLYPRDVVIHMMREKLQEVASEV